MKEKGLPRSRLMDLTPDPDKQFPKKPSKCSKNLFPNFRGLEASPKTLKSSPTSDQSLDASPVPTRLMPAGKGQGGNCVENRIGNVGSVIGNFASNSLKPAVGLINQGDGSMDGDAEHLVSGTYSTMPTVVSGTYTVRCQLWRARLTVRCRLEESSKVTWCWWTVS